MSSLFVRLLFAISPTIPLKNTDDGVRGRWDEMWGFLFRSNKETLIFVKSVSESLGSSTLNKEKTNPIRQILVMRTKPCLLVLVCPFKGAWINYSHGQRSWSTFVFVGLSLNNTCPTPPPPHKLQVGRVYPEFSRVSVLYSVGGGRTARHFVYCFMRAPRNYRKSRILDCCPKDFYTRHQLVELQS